MHERVERVAARGQAGHWLLEWGEHGWVPAAAPKVVGRTALGDDVLRFALVRTRRDSARPAIPELPDWRPLRPARAAPHRLAQDGAHDDGGW